MCIFTPALSKSTLANACDLKVKQPNALGARYYCLVGGEKKMVTNKTTCRCFLHPDEIVKD